MNVYEAVNQQEFLDLIASLGITFKNDGMVLIKPSLGFIKVWQHFKMVVQ